MEGVRLTLENCASLTSLNCLLCLAQLMEYFKPKINDLVSLFNFLSKMLLYHISNSKSAGCCTANLIKLETCIAN